MRDHCAYLADRRGLCTMKKTRLFVRWLIKMIVRIISLAIVSTTTHLTIVYRDIFTRPEVLRAYGEFTIVDFIVANWDILSILMLIGVLSLITLEWSFKNVQD